MRFITRYFPDDYVEDVFAIDYRRLYALGYRGLIFDIDNTLVPHGADSTADTDALFAYLKDLGFGVILLSNNSEERIRRFLGDHDIPYIHDAGKPAPGNFLKAARMLGLSPRCTVMIGDTTSTDIAGANRAGIPSVLVKYIGYHTRHRRGIRRRLERIVLYLYTHLSHKPAIYTIKPEN